MLNNFTIKNRLVGILIAILFIIGILYGYNYIGFQFIINQVIANDERNKGVNVSVHYGAYINPSVLVYNIISISGKNSMMDVFRVFLQFADKMQSNNFETIELCFQGKPKFKIKGIYFQSLGKGYSSQNPIYTIRTFPENLMKMDGSRAYPEWTGGWLGVMGKQMEDFNDFHKKWYIEDIAKLE
jgi:hypothetical protein